MDPKEYPYAGMILPDSSNLDPAAYLDSAAGVLARIDPDPAAAPHRSAHGNKVLGRRVGVSVFVEEESDYGPKVVLEVITADGDVPDEELAARVLSDVVLACVSHSEADILEWYAPDVLLDVEDFVRLRSYVSPRRLLEVDEDVTDSLFAADSAVQTMTETLYGAPEPGSESAQPDITDRLSQYNIQIEAQEPDKRRLDVAGHLITGVVGIVFFPAAVFLFIVTLVRGMDFRLVTQVLAVTALFSALYNADHLSGTADVFIR